MEPPKPPAVVVVIPTRNRSHLAVNAIRSVLEQPVETIRVIVSDNFTEEPDRFALAAFCEQLVTLRRTRRTQKQKAS